MSPTRPGPQAMNKIAPTFEEAVRRATRVRRKNRRLPKWARRLQVDVVELSAAVSAIEDVLLRWSRKAQ